SSFGDQNNGGKFCDFFSGMKETRKVWRFSVKAGCLKRVLELRVLFVSAMGMVIHAHFSLKVCKFLLFFWIAKIIAVSGYSIYAIDHLGFGLSVGLHGYTPSFDELVDNVIECYRNIKEDVKPAPAILLVLSVMSSFLPEAKLVPDTDLGELAFRETETRKKKMVSSPLLVLHGAADKVTDSLVSKFLYEKACSTDKTLKIYPEGCHCILEGEPDERIYTVLDDIVSWLDSRCTVQ
ncbi:hypothetical protein IFM89_007431, partial [Coptis chinensis]